MRRQPGEDGKVGVRLRGAGLEAMVEAVAGEVRVRGRGVEGCEGRGDVWLAVEVGEEGGGGRLALLERCAHDSRQYRRCWKAELKLLPKYWVKPALL